MGEHKKEKQKRRKKKKERVFKCCLNAPFKKIGKSLIDRIIDKVPFELHAPNYQFCGPGTHLDERLKRGDSGINPLDAACKTHDIAYSQHKESSERGKADKILQKEAFKRVFSRDASLGERAVALGVAAAMKVKRTLSGNGFANKKRTIRRNKKKKKKKTNKKKRQNKKVTVSFSTVIKNAKVLLKKSKPNNLIAAIKVVNRSIKNSKCGKRILPPRIIKLPSISGGVLPLIPIFAGLGALGSIVGSTAGIANAISQARKGQKELEESGRHNRTMEAIAIGNKVGHGFYLHTNTRGNGFYLSSRSKNR